MNEIHIKIDSIPGEAIAVDHKDEIHVGSWAWSVGAAPASGAGNGKPSFADLSFTHAVDRASPELWKACASSRHLKEATLSVARAGLRNGPKDFLVIRMSEVTVTAVSLSDVADGAAPLETVTLHFARVSYDYRQQKPDGSFGATVTFAYDMRANRVL